MKCEECPYFVRRPLTESEMKWREMQIIDVIIDTRFCSIGWCLREEENNENTRVIV